MQGLPSTAIGGRRDAVAAHSRGLRYSATASRTSSSRSAMRARCRRVLTAPVAMSNGRLPRVTRLMALAIRLDGLIRAGEIVDYADIARLGHVTRARASQIMNLLNLCPRVQEDLLILPPVERGRDPVSERDMRPIAAVPDWRKQRRMWRDVCKATDSRVPSIPWNDSV
jgi:hypothetical protein